MIALGASALGTTNPRPAATEDRKPFFRFHPFAYDLQALTASTAPCEICQRPCIWRHNVPIYSRTEYDNVCASCIANGRLLQVDPTMQLHDISVTNCDPALERELMTRTPGVASFNPFDWPVIGRMPLAFFGEGNSPRFRGDKVVLAAIGRDWKAMDGEGQAPLHHSLIFRQIDGGTVRAVFDFD